VPPRVGRCLDLYLCPRTRQKRVHVDDPKSLLPALPKPRDLQPFPTRLAKRFTGHTAQVSFCVRDVSNAVSALTLQKVTTATRPNMVGAH